MVIGQAELWREEDRIAGVTQSVALCEGPGVGHDIKGNREKERTSCQCLSPHCSLHLKLGSVNHCTSIIHCPSKPRTAHEGCLTTHASLVRHHARCHHATFIASQFWHKATIGNISKPSATTSMWSSLPGTSSRDAGIKDSGTAPVD